MFSFNTSPLEDISTDKLRRNLRFVLDEVNFGESRFAVLRRGRPVAGLVPITEARAIYEATRADRSFVREQLNRRARRQEILRRALSGQDPVAEFEASNFGYSEEI